VAISSVEWVAGLPFSRGLSLAGRLSKVGGTLMLTDDSLIFRPVGDLGRKRGFLLSEIRDVTAYADRPPRLLITPHSGSPLPLIVLPRRLSTMWADSSARDEAVSVIGAVLKSL
jgi:hypothetical protein